MALRVVRPDLPDPGARLAIRPELATEYLVSFLRAEIVRRRGMSQVVLGLSGGVDSALSAALAARALGPGNVHAVMLPYRTSSPESLEHARLVAGLLGIASRVVEISAMVDGYCAGVEGISALRLGNVCARCRMTVLYDVSAEVGGLVLGTSNKTERLLGYYTWHADDAPAVNPLGDLWKTQVWALARHLGLPDEVVEKAPTADLVPGQTDESDLGVTYPEADAILAGIVAGRPKEALVAEGCRPEAVERVWARHHGTHWKRHAPTVAVASDSAVNVSYLRPVDYGLRA